MAAGEIFFSVVIPAHNEESGIVATCEAIIARFAVEHIADYEIVVVNDNSHDRTAQILESLCAQHATLRYVNNAPPNGFGFAVRRGLAEFRGRCVAVVMGDLSDSPDDIVAYYCELKQGADCVFGSRFMRGARVVDYPSHKYVLNRLANWFIKILFHLPYNDVTNAFKAYRREVIADIQPLFAQHFNLTVEMPLKAVIRGHSFKVIPISWHNRKSGKSKLRIHEMGSRYLFTILNIYLEKILMQNRGLRKRRPACHAGGQKS